jgi:hypothetical protein
MTKRRKAWVLAAATYPAYPSCETWRGQEELGLGEEVGGGSEEDDERGRE